MVAQQTAVGRSEIDLDHLRPINASARGAWRDPNPHPLWIDRIYGDQGGWVDVSKLRDSRITFRLGTSDTNGEAAEREEKH